MSVLGNLTRAVVGIAVLPIDAVADVVTMGGVLSGKSGTYTAKRDARDAAAIQCGDVNTQFQDGYLKGFDAATAHHADELTRVRERVQELEQATTLQPLDGIPAGWVNVYQNGRATLFKSEEIARSVTSTPETEFAIPLYRHPITDAACVAQLVRSGWEDSGVRNACYRTVAVNENRRCLIAPSVP